MQATNTPEINEVFAMKGRTAMVYMGDTFEMRDYQTNEVQRIVPMDAKMIEQLPAQYAKFLAVNGSRMILAAKA